MIPLPNIFMCDYIPGDCSFICVFPLLDWFACLCFRSGDERLLQKVNGSLSLSSESLAKSGHSPYCLPNFTLVSLKLYFQVGLKGSFFDERMSLLFSRSSSSESLWLSSSSSSQSFKLECIHTLILFPCLFFSRVIICCLDSLFGQPSFCCQPSHLFSTLKLLSGNHHFEWSLVHLSSRFPDKSSKNLSCVVRDSLFKSK